MTDFRFMHAHFPDPELARDAVISRLTAHRRKLLAAKADRPRPLNADGTVDEQEWLDRQDGIRLSLKDQRKIENRAEMISQEHRAGTGLSHLRPEDAKRLDVLRHGVRLARIETEHQADELAAALHAEFPWMGPANEIVWHAMRRSVKAGDPGLRLPPLLLDGPPGIGKSAWARYLGNVIGAPTMAYEATIENASFGLVGTQRSWGSANPGRLINTILTHRVGNPVIVVDEVEKSGRATATKGQSYNLTDALLPLLEPMSASNWSCPYFEVKFDMSFVIWVLTSNDYRRLPEPLLSRSIPIRLSAISRGNLVGFAHREGARRGLSQPSIEAITNALLRSEFSTEVSLRSVLRMLECGMTMETRDAMLH
jgi:hypothetical protein